MAVRLPSRFSASPRPIVVVVLPSPADLAPVRPQRRLGDAERGGRLGDRLQPVLARDFDV
jgi:hypothetical protein